MSMREGEGLPQTKILKLVYLSPTNWVTMIGLPIGTAVAVGIMIIVPILTYILYRIDHQRGEGYVTVLGRR